MSRSGPGFGAQDAPAPVFVLVVLAVSLALNLALTVISISRNISAPQPSPAAFVIDRTGWYAVFIGDHEAFVGHMTELSPTDIQLNDVFHLTYEVDPLIANPRNEDFKPVLKRYGQEVLGPKDIVRLNRQTIRYYTQLRSDSSIVKAISQFEHPTVAPAPSPTPT